jgi:hypothetical protein
MKAIQYDKIVSACDRHRKASTVAIDELCRFWRGPFPCPSNFNRDILK